MQTATGSTTQCKRATCFSLWLFGGFIAGSAVAESTTRNQVDALDKVVITGTRLGNSLRDVPAAVSVITQDDIQLARQQLTLVESLGGVPGLFLQDRYNLALGLRVSIRGFGARANFGVRGVKILIDGIPETLPDGQASADTIDLGATSRIEVIRGPSSTLYGNASGGVILVTTEPPPDEPFVEARVAGGDFGFRKVQLKAGGQGDRVGYLVSVSDWKYDGFREHSRAEKKDVTGRFNFDFGGDRRLLATISYGKQPVALDPGGVTAAMAADQPTAARPANIAFDARQHYEQTRLGLVYDTPLGRHYTLTARNYYVWRDYIQFLPYQAGGVPAFSRFFAGIGANLNHEGAWFDRPNRFVFGFDVENQDDDRSRYDNDFGVRGAQSLEQNERVTSRGIYAQDEFSITPRLLLTVGARYDEIVFKVADRFLVDGDDSGKVTETSTSPMAALMFAHSPAFNLYGKYSTSFEVPTTSEYARPDGSGGFNQSLGPQLSNNFEIGMRGMLAGRHHYELALYSSTTRDEFVPYEVPGSPGHDYFVNAGRSDRSGLEFSLQSELTDRWRTTLSYTFSDFTFDRFVDADGNDFSGNTLPGTAKSQLYGDLTYRHPRGWFGSFDAMYVGRQFADNANTATNGAYTLANIRFGIRLESGAFEVTPFVAANNLFDERYNANVRINAFGGRYFEAGAGRDLFAGVGLRYRY
ncbi:MAG: Vitamin B12 transporter BtuB [Steroidobacteraceae bacterium]|nr:Vitamin B12 transporter BtuB [Steroidobacteraceae bacterium]